MSYKDKYLKYKSKYLILKKQLGGEGGAGGASGAGGAVVDQEATEADTVGRAEHEDQQPGGPKNRVK